MCLVRDLIVVAQDGTNGLAIVRYVRRFLCRHVVRAVVAGFLFSVVLERAKCQGIRFVASVPPGDLRGLVVGHVFLVLDRWFADLLRAFRHRFVNFLNARLYCVYVNYCLLAVSSGRYGRYGAQCRVGRPVHRQARRRVAFKERDGVVLLSGAGVLIRCFRLFLTYGIYGDLDDVTYSLFRVRFVLFHDRHFVQAKVGVGVARLCNEGLVDSHVAEGYRVLGSLTAKRTQVYRARFVIRLQVVCFGVLKRFGFQVERRFRVANAEGSGFSDGDVVNLSVYAVSEEDCVRLSRSSQGVN